MAHPKLITTTLDFHGTEGATYVIDLARALSLYNRRTYRQGYVYSVDYIEYIGSATDIISVGKIPESYSTLGAYEIGFNAWRTQRANVLEESDVLEPGRWADFKCWMNEDHADGAWPELMPRGLGANLVAQPLDLTGAEWIHAQLEYHDVGAATTSQVNVGMLGSSNLAAAYGSLYHQYGVTRSATLSPDPLIPDAASGAWITRTGEESAAMSTEVIEYIEEDNNQPPYANQADTALDPTYVGNGQSAPRGVLVDASVAGTTGRSVTLNGGLIPLGLIACAVGSVSEFTIRVHMTRGSYKGVAAKPMGSFR